MINLPESFKQRMKAQLGNEYESFIAEYSNSPVKGLRVNTLKMNLQSFKEQFPNLSPCGTSPEGFIISDDGSFARHPYHRGGAYYLQEPSAMSVGAYFADKKLENRNLKILDMCAAPGGKTSAIAGYMQGSGIIVANEYVKSRATELAGNVERMGICNAVVVNARPDMIAQKLPEYFDIVVVDAPCSGEGMFRKNPEAISEWSPQHVLSCAVRQKAILNSAAHCLKPGGFLVYSTCTFSEEENEGVTESLKETLKIITRQRLYPHTCAGEGHFMCVMQKKESNFSEKPKGRIEKQERLAYKPCKDKIFYDFLSETYITGPAQNAYSSADGKVVFANDEMLTISAKLPCVSCGVLAGYVKNGYFEPSHTLFMAANGAKFRLEANLSEDELSAFLHGECVKSPFDESEKGWCAVCFNGLPVGFGKVTGGVIKNKLPKGLRSLK